MLQNFRADNQIECVTFVGQMTDVCNIQLPGSAAVLPQLIVKLQTVPGFHDVLNGEVCPDDKGIPAAVGFAGMSAASTTDIEDAGTRCDGDPVKIDGDHG